MDDSQVFDADYRQSATSGLEAYSLVNTQHDPHLSLSSGDNPVPFIEPASALHSLENRELSLERYCECFQVFFEGGWLHVCWLKCC